MSEPRRHTVLDCEPRTEYYQVFDPRQGVYLIQVTVCGICGRRLP